MTRYITGINSVSFLEAFNLFNSLFDKRKIKGIEEPDKIFLVRAPVIIGLNGTEYLLKHKSSARRAIELSGMRKGVPLILECALKPAELEFSEEHPHWVVYHSPLIRISEIYRITKRYPLIGIDLAYALKKTTVEELEESHVFVSLISG